MIALFVSTNNAEKLAAVAACLNGYKPKTRKKARGVPRCSSILDPKESLAVMNAFLKAFPLEELAKGVVDESKDTPAQPPSPDLAGTTDEPLPPKDQASTPADITTALTDLNDAGLIDEAQKDQASTSEPARRQLQLEDVREKLKLVNAAKGVGTAVALLKRFNVTRVSDVPKDSYLDFAIAVEEALLENG